MVQAGGGLSFTAKTRLEGRVGSEVGTQLLDRNGPPEPFVDSKADLRHATPAQRLAQFVSAPDRRWAARHPHDPPSTPVAVLSHVTPEREMAHLLAARASDFLRRVQRSDFVIDPTVMCAADSCSRRSEQLVIVPLF